MNTYFHKKKIIIFDKDMQTKRFEHTDTEYRENGKYKISQPHYYRALSLNFFFSFKNKSLNFFLNKC